LSRDFKHRRIGLSLAQITVSDDKGNSVAADRWLSPLFSNKLRLIHLDLSSTDLTDRGLLTEHDQPRLEADSQFRSLQLSGNPKITDNGLNSLKGRLGAETILLNLAGTKTTDAALASVLSKTANLRNLKLAGTYAFGTNAGKKDASKEMISALKALQKLAILDLSKTGLTDETLQKIWQYQRWRSLSTLSISGTKTSDKALIMPFPQDLIPVFALTAKLFQRDPTPPDYLVGFPHLTRLTYSDTKITAAGINRRNALLGPLYSKIKID